MIAISVTTSYLLSKYRLGTTGCLTEQPGYHKRCILVSAGRVVCGSGFHRFPLVVVSVRSSTILVHALVCAPF